ncbi:hypothetical protein [Verrucomicrobium sp. BvORR106]|uniref:hypothetical protein n=1 Tax=Verrucomicrobium sp. BvORR106 TaxID=1403819 RepID=UPI00057029D2|nr:hypothetical protein [Verrucomicrobium sp. BvORR106]
MNIEDDELERRLQALQPAAVPEPLAARLQQAQPKRPHWWYLTAAMTGVAVLFLRFPPHPEEVTAPAPGLSPAVTAQTPAEPLEDLRVFLPIEQTSTLVKVEKVGVLETDPERPIQLMRTFWVDDVTYRGDDGVSTFQRQESRMEIVPVAMQTY